MCDDIRTRNVKQTVWNFIPNRVRIYGLVTRWWPGEGRCQGTLCGNHKVSPFYYGRKKWPAGLFVADGSYSLPRGLWLGNFAWKLQSTLADLSGRRALRSAVSTVLLCHKSSNCLQSAVEPSRSTTAQLWNSLPDDIVLADSPSTFRHQLKHYIYCTSSPIPRSCTVTVAQLCYCDTLSGPSSYCRPTWATI